MSEEILINVTPVETRVALVENGMLQEVFIERAGRRGIVGNIYKGKVIRVLPGMEAAFVDIGLERAAFIHASDLSPEGRSEADELDLTKPAIDISSMVHEGQTLIVQVTKDPIGTKGARLTTHLSIPSRYLVFMPNNQHIGISQRIEDEEERERLKTILTEVQTQQADENGGMAGYIIRTVAEGVGEAELRDDVIFLNKLWKFLGEKK
jgi:ribonuclease G